MMTASYQDEFSVPRDWPGNDSSICVRASDVDWHVQRHGASGPVIVLIHGAGASLHSWQLIWPLLEQRNQVVVLDLPGHGFSSAFAGAYTLERTAQALDDLFAVLQISPQVVVGHSAGGAIAMQWALSTSNAPRAIATINPALLPFNGLAGLTFPVLARVMANTPMLSSLIAARARSRSGIERLISGTGSRIPESLLDGYHVLMRSPRHVKSVLTMMGCWQLEGLLDRWRQAGLPLFAALGSLDRAVPAHGTQQALRDIEQVTVERWPSRGHLAHEESPQQVIDWLQRSGLVNA